MDYWTLAQLRYYIRRFLRAREISAQAVGIEPQQYLLLLQLKGLEGKQPATVSTLAERLQLRHHSTVELVDRLVKKRMAVRRRHTHDRRAIVVELRPPGERVLKKLALEALEELRKEGPALVSILQRLIRGQRSPRRRMRGASALTA
ncbi:MAG TPA: MarR family transcriptional regulator [Chloroflexota bacterium]